ncbi:uncharacterized protein [Atheta coriaria]|uniref:uncharacterized protein n=1 Tax=Dalotia coriaria TaxID=877792 RepID=UPI0031F3635C
MENKIFEDEVMQMFNCTREVLDEGLPELGLPSLKDIEIPLITIDLKDLEIPGASGFIILNNTVISGLTNLELSDLKINPIIIGGLGISIKAKLTLSLFVIATEYMGEFTINNYDIFGNGQLRHVMQNLVINLQTEIMFHNVRSVYLAKFRAVPNVEDIKLEISGFFNDEEQSALLSQLVEEEASSWVNGKSQDIADVIEEFVLNLGNIDIVSTTLLNEYPNINDIINAILKNVLLTKYKHF